MCRFPSQRGGHRRGHHDRKVGLLPGVSWTHWPRLCSSAPATANLTLLSLHCACRWFVLDAETHDLVSVHTDGDEIISNVKFSPGKNTGGSDLAAGETWTVIGVSADFEILASCAFRWKLPGCLFP